MTGRYSSDSRYMSMGLATGALDADTSCPGRASEGGDKQRLR